MSVFILGFHIWEGVKKFGGGKSSTCVQSISGLSTGNSIVERSFSTMARIYNRIRQGLLPDKFVIR